MKEKQNEANAIRVYFSSFSPVLCGLKEMYMLAICAYFPNGTFIKLSTVIYASFNITLRKLETSTLLYHSWAPDFMSIFVVV